MHFSTQCSSLSQVWLGGIWNRQFHQNTWKGIQPVGLNPAQKILVHQLNSQYALQDTMCMSPVAVWLPVLHVQMTTLLILLHLRSWRRGNGGKVKTVPFVTDVRPWNLVWKIHDAMIKEAVYCCHEVQYHNIFSSKEQDEAVMVEVLVFVLTSRSLFSCFVVDHNNVNILQSQ